MGLWGFGPVGVVRLQGSGPVWLLCSGPKEWKALGRWGGWAMPSWLGRDAVTQQGFEWGDGGLCGRGPVE